MARRAIARVRVRGAKGKFSAVGRSSSRSSVVPPLPATAAAISRGAGSWSVGAPPGVAGDSSAARGVGPEALAAASSWGPGVMGTP